MFKKLKQLFSPNKEKSESLYTSLAGSAKHNSFWNGITSIFKGKQYVDEDVLEQMEELLLSADVSFETTTKILEKFSDLYKQSAKEHNQDFNFFQSLLLKSTLPLFTDNINNSIVHNDTSIREESTSPYIILVLGVNGAGKTTTIAKLAHQIKQSQMSVILGAGDTFRAGAVEQLEQWAVRLNIPLIKKVHNSSPASVAFDTIKSSIEMQADVAIIDTSGRLHNNVSLMNELKKIVITIQKQLPEAPHETLLIIDGTSGQNALEQAKKFCELTPVSGIIVTKLDGTAKGGILISIADTLQIPINYIGTGEKLDDLVIFDSQTYLKKVLNIEK